jgi:2-phosphosulfolactate phosphatase
MSSAVSEWGPEGARKFDGSVGAIIIVDVLSFSTCIDIAVSRGAIVYPFHYRDPRAETEEVHRLGAEIAGPRDSENEGCVHRERMPAVGSQ